MASSSSRVQAVVRNSSVSASAEELVKMRASRAHPQRFGFIGDAFLTGISSEFDGVETVLRLGKLDSGNGRT